MGADRVPEKHPTALIYVENTLGRLVSFVVHRG